MTHRAPIALFVVALSWLLMGCSATFVPFTHELRARHNLSDGDMQQLQYYVSHEVKLRREAQTTGRDISGGNLKILEGKTIQEVIIHQHTPGVATAIDAHSITISFSEGSELRFSLRTGESMPLRKLSGEFAEPPDAFPGDHDHHTDEHQSLDELLGSYWLDSDSDAMILFQGRQWNGMEDSYRAHLVIDAESLEEVVETQDVLKGRKLGSRSEVRMRRVN
jgi:hypothetical protein